MVETWPTGDDVVRAKTRGIPLLLRRPPRPHDIGLVVAFDPGPPEGLEAFARALPLPGVGAWKAYLGLPLVGYRQPSGGVEEIARRQRSDFLLELLWPALNSSVSDLPFVVSDLRTHLDLAADAPLAILGSSAGGLAVLLALADRPLPVTAAVVIGAGPDARVAVAAAERAFGISYHWTPAAKACARRLDFRNRASDIARGTPAVLVLRGAEDDVIPAAGIEQLDAALRPYYARVPDRLRIETLTGVAHGLDADGRVADMVDEWLCEHLLPANGAS